MAVATNRTFVIHRMNRGDPDSVMDALPLRMPSEDTRVFDDWRTPFWGASVVIGGPLPPRRLAVPPLAWEDDSAMRSSWLG